MKKLITFIFLLTGGLSGAALALAQEHAISKFAPLAEIKKAFEAPTDMLNDTLQKVQTIQNTTPQQPTKQITDLTTDTDEIRNPFIAQTPRENKTVTAPTPTQAPIATNPSLPVPQFTVSGLVWNTQKPAAILNGKIVGIGDQISNWAITQITRDGVQVTFEDQNLWVKPVNDPSNPARPNQRFNR